MEEVEETVPKNSSMDDKTTIVGYEESPFHNFTASTDTRLTPNELMPQSASGEKNYIKGFAIGFISNVFGTLTKRGHSSITYVFEKK